MSYDAWIAIGWVVLGTFLGFMLINLIKAMERKPELESGVGCVAPFISLGILFCAIMAWVKIGQVLFP